MNEEEFDKFADEYLGLHKRNIRLTGEEPEFFARYKVELTAHLWSTLGCATPTTILDFGCGIGNSLPHLARSFRSAEIKALDVSKKSLDIAARRFPGLATIVHSHAGEIPLPSESIDLVFSACVFHHIEPTEHVPILAALRRLLRPGGKVVIFEHNPLNPVTRYIVATCEFDENAILIPSRLLKQRQKLAGFKKVHVGYSGFFPHSLRLLRAWEPYLRRLPFGAQYFTVAGN
jgi:ubiquinone/menaquinone biosynthesis C-methylase UbiE